MKEWMKRICTFFTKSPIALVEIARETSLPRLGTLVFFLFRFFYVECHPGNSGNISLKVLTKLYIDLLFFTSKNCTINIILL